MTHTYALLEVSPAAYDEIAAKLREAGYNQAFGDEGEIDMHGIALGRADSDECSTSPGNDEPAPEPNDTGGVQASPPAVRYCIGCVHLKFDDKEMSSGSTMTGSWTREEAAVACAKWHWKYHLTEGPMGFDFESAMEHAHTCADFQERPSPDDAQGNPTC
jgi:hypothetical protein